MENKTAVSIKKHFDLCAFVRGRPGFPLKHWWKKHTSTVCGVRFGNLHQMVELQCEILDVTEMQQQ